MKIKSLLWSTGALILVIGLFDFFCLWFVEDYTNSFYISIIFGNVSILVYALSTLMMAAKGRYLYLSIQNGFIICSYTVICVVLNLIFALCRMDNLTANIVTNSVILVVYFAVLFVIYANAAAIMAQLKKDRKDRNAFYKLKDKAEELLNRGENLQMNKKIESMYDKICSCQISTDVKVKGVDSFILLTLADLETSLNDGDDEEVILRRIDKVMELVEDRNKKILNSLKR